MSESKHTPEQQAMIEETWRWSDGSGDGPDGYRQGIIADRNWKHVGRTATTIMTANHGLPDAEAIEKRAIDCHNACANMADPAAEIAALKSQIDSHWRAWMFVHGTVFPENSAWAGFNDPAVLAEALRAELCAERSYQDAKIAALRERVRLAEAEADALRERVRLADDESGAYWAFVDNSDDKLTIPLWEAWVAATAARDAGEGQR